MNTKWRRGDETTQKKEEARWVQEVKMKFSAAQTRWLKSFFVVAGFIILDFHRNQENQTSIDPDDEPNSWNGPFFSNRMKTKPVPLTSVCLADCENDSSCSRAQTKVLKSVGGGRTFELACD